MKRLTDLFLAETVAALQFVSNVFLSLLLRGCQRKRIIWSAVSSLSWLSASRTKARKAWTRPRWIPS